MANVERCNQTALEQGEKKMEWIPQPGRINHRQQWATMLVAPMGETKKTSGMAWK